ncbi:MAG: 50S ribosomal protein L9 [Chloroflexota bacterium]
MKIILTQTVAGLGEAGTVKEVADGYARNYLLPQKLAVLATRGSLKQAEAQAGVYSRRANKALTEAQQAAAALEGKTITIRARVGSENRLYGSVTAADLADALQSQYNVTMDRRKIGLDEAIHRTGTYAATADFGQGVSAKFNVEVASEVAGAHGKASIVTGAAPVPAVEEAAEEATVESSDEASAEGSTEA